MKLISHFYKNKKNQDTLHKELRHRFDRFRKLLEYNNHILYIIGDLEEKAQGDFLFDLAFIRHHLEDLYQSIRETISMMVDIGGDQYQELQTQVLDIESSINSLLPGGNTISEDDYVLDFEFIDKTRSASIGNKNAQLGEMLSLGINVPKGYAISAWSYQNILDVNYLQEKISKFITTLDVKNHQDLVTVSEKIQDLIQKAEIPQVIQDEIVAAYGRLKNKSQQGDLVAVRSSAIGEDSIFSFAGQYSSFLNVPEKDLIKRYRDILASKFTPNAIYYLLSHTLDEAQLGMSVGVTEMVHSKASGVIYTRDPLNRDNSTINIHSSFGLGSFVVEGIVTPDLIRVDRSTKKVFQKQIQKKEKQLVLLDSGGTEEQDIPEELQGEASIDDSTAIKLAEIALKLEEHYSTPLDLEWALNRENNEIYILQARPLRSVYSTPSEGKTDLSKYETLLRSGTTVCPGSSGGKVRLIHSLRDLDKVEKGDIVVAHHPSPTLVKIIEKASVVLTEIGSGASHFAALARENRIPTIAGMKGVFDVLNDGEMITVDASDCVIFKGIQQEYIEASMVDFDLFTDTPIFDLLRKLLKKIASLNLVNPSDPAFKIENCQTYHDIIRFTHQRGIEEIFLHAQKAGSLGSGNGLIKSKMPLPVRLLNLDKRPGLFFRNVYNETKLPSLPLDCFWHGILKEGWPTNLPDSNKFVAVSATTGGNQRAAQFTENSFAVVATNYMLISLRLGFHFTSVEAMISDDETQNFIRVHYKGGGAAADRRLRRIRLLEELLERMGFEHSVKSDFINSSISNMSKENAEEILLQLGRLTMMTKQLDMALSNDRVAHWYTEDFAKRIGLVSHEAFPS